MLSVDACIGKIKNTSHSQVIQTQQLDKYNSGFWSIVDAFIRYQCVEDSDQQ